MLATIQSSIAYRAVLATATIATKTTNGVRNNPAMTVNGSPTKGAQLSSKDQTPQRAYHFSARRSCAALTGNHDRSRRRDANRPNPQFTQAPSVLPRLATSSSVISGAARLACMTSNTASDCAGKIVAARKAEPKSTRRCKYSTRIADLP